MERLPRIPSPKQYLIFSGRTARKNVGGPEEHWVADQVEALRGEAKPHRDLRRRV